MSWTFRRILSLRTSVNSCEDSTALEKSLTTCHEEHHHFFCMGRLHWSDADLVEGLRTPRTRFVHSEAFFGISASGRQFGCELPGQLWKVVENVVNDVWRAHFYARSVDLSSISVTRISSWETNTEVASCSCQCMARGQPQEIDRGATQKFSRHMDSPHTPSSTCIFFDTHSKNHCDVSRALGKRTQGQVQDHHARRQRQQGIVHSEPCNFSDKTRFPEHFKQYQTISARVSF